MDKEEIEILYDFANNDNTEYCWDWQGFDWGTICPLIDKMIKENQELKDRISEVKWKPIEEYQKPKYDWVLVKYYIEPEFECIPCVAEKRFGKWYDRNDILINGEVRYFFDMQLLDILDKGDKEC